MNFRAYKEKVENGELWQITCVDYLASVTAEDALHAELYLIKYHLKNKDKLNKRIQPSVALLKYYFYFIFSPENIIKL